MHSFSVHAKAVRDQQQQQQMMSDFVENNRVVRHIDDCIGKGVFTTSRRKKGEFLTFCTGELISEDEVLRRESVYTESDGSFMLSLNMDANKQQTRQGRHNRMCIQGSLCQL